MGKIKYQIGITGTLVGMDLVMAQALSNSGFSCVVFRNAEDGLPNLKEELGYFYNSAANFDVKLYSSPLDFIRNARSCNVLVGFGLGFLAAVRYLYPAKFCKNFPPIMNISTGADMAEFIDSKSIKARLYKHHLYTSAFNASLPFPHTIKNSLRYKIPNSAFIPFVFPINDNEEVFFPNNKVLTLFHPTRLDWNEASNESGRNTTKGNNRFIKAYAKAIKAGVKAHCHILERGTDLENAKRLIASLGIQTYFTWHKELPREKLFNLMKMSDVIVDQFDYGGFGGIAAEAMSLGKPLITYVNKNSAVLLYGNDIPPVLNSWSEQEIFEAILKCEDRNFLIENGLQSKEWIIRHHHWRNCLDKFKYYYSLLSGETVMDYGWKKTP